MIIQACRKIASLNGQSTLEYIILTTAIVGVLIVFFGPAGVFSKATKLSYSTVGNSMVDMARLNSPGSSTYIDPLGPSIVRPAP